MPLPDLLAVEDEEDVHCANLADVFLLYTVEPENLGIALLVGDGLRAHTGGIVTAGLGLADTTLNGSYIIILDPDLNRVKSFRIVSAYRRADDHEEICI